MEKNDSETQTSFEKNPATIRFKRAEKSLTRLDDTPALKNEDSRRWMVVLL